MDLKNQFTKTPYLVLFVVLISISVGTASALITITLDGDVDITENLDVVGTITGQTIDNLQNQINAAGISAETQTQIDGIEGNVTSPIFGLEEIKNEVRFIEGNVTSPTFGLEEIKIEVANIETTIESLATNGFIEKPNTLFIDGSNTEITLSGSGAITLPLDKDVSPTIADVDEFRKYCLLVSDNGISPTILNVVFGKLSGSTIANSIDVSFNDIHCFDVNGPQIAITLKGGSPSATETVNFWVYMTS